MPSNRRLRQRRRRRRLIVRIPLAVIALLALIGVGGWFYFNSSLPKTSGRVSIPGLTAQVTVTRDARGVPTIDAGSERDAAFALGYVHAQDRLFQMDLMRRYGAGRLAEWFGEPALQADRFTRTLGIYRASQAQYDHLSLELRGVLDAYAAGVNAWINTRHGALPPEYQLLLTAPDPWTPADTLVWGKIMDLQLTANFRGELARARLLKRLTPEQLDILYPPYPDDAPSTGSRASLDGTLLDKLAAALPEAPSDPVRASNNWAVSGDNTVSGKPLLANDTHLGFGSPGVWYLARLRVNGHTLAGVTAPGTPFVVVGHNDRISWGFTTTASDVADLFIEDTDPADPSRYIAPGGAQAFTTRTETIEVHNGKTVEMPVRTTRHGPVISDLAGWNADDGKVLALQATWLADDDRTPDALWKLSHAGNWGEFRDAMRDFVAPEQNIVYADADGHIGFIAPARVPIRAAGNGWLPVPGADGAHDWTGFVPFDSLPQDFDPPTGKLFSANNRIVAKDDYFLGRDWDLPYRVTRIGALLDKGKQSPDTAAAMQGDDFSGMAQELLPLMLRDLPASPRAADVVTKLGGWDYRMARNRTEPLIFVAWLREFNRALFQDRLGPSFADYWGPRPNVVKAIITEHPEWCGDRGCAAVLSATLERALDDLGRRFGPEMENWHWGDAHVAVFTHPFWAHVPVVNDRWTPRIATSGASDTLDAGAPSFANEETPFASRLGPVMRMIVDMADPNGARFVVVPGQSGNPLSPHWSDLVTDWRDLAYLRFTDDASGGRLVLAP